MEHMLGHFSCFLLGPIRSLGSLILKVSCGKHCSEVWVPVKAMQGSAGVRDWGVGFNFWPWDQGSGLRQFSI